FNAVQAAMMSIDFSAPASGVTQLKKAQSSFVALAAQRFAAVPEKVEQTSDAEQTATSEQVMTLDLSGVACPMNFVKTKIKLAGLPIGAQLAVILDDGAPIENVPLSLEEQGQKVLEKKQISDTQWQIVVEKTV
ncbi:MAG: sulfurtransferase TusA family protein, partial [Ghiorsea sp.]|nr:sulfurtransferase TusA family protein [Ghiorsea sp.]